MVPQRGEAATTCRFFTALRMTCHPGRSKGRQMLSATCQGWGLSVAFSVLIYSFLTVSRTANGVLSSCFPLWFLCVVAGVVLFCFKNSRFLSSYVFLCPTVGIVLAFALSTLVLWVLSANAEQHGCMGQMGCRRLLPFGHWTGRSDRRSGWILRPARRINRGLHWQ